MGTALSRRLAELVDAAGYGHGRDRSIADLHRVLIGGSGANCSRVALDNWLIGKRVPTLTHLSALLTALAVDRETRDEVVRLALPDGLLSANRAIDEDDVDTVNEGTPGGPL